MPNAFSMSLIHVVDSLEFGGLERVVTDLAIEQRNRGHRVAVFSINETSGFAPELRQAGVEVISGDKRKPFDLQVLRRLRQAGVEREARVVHAHNFVPNYYAAAALLGTRIPLVGTCHDMGTRLSNPRLRLIYRCSLLRTARVAMVGRQVHDRYVASGLVKPGRASTVLNGIPVDRFVGTEPRRAEARRRLGLADDALVIGCVGRLVALKNHRVLIELLPALAQAHPKVKLVIVGYGELQQALLAQAGQLGVADHLLITGQRSDVADLLPGFDVFALPSLTEGLSIALLEACATGLPVVATRVGGNPEIIQHEQSGLLVPVNDAPALGAALLRLLDERHLRQRLGESASRWVRGNASVAALADAYERFYCDGMKG